MTTPSLRNIAPGVHVLEGPQRFYGIEVGTRMTVLEVEGGLLVHSPIAVDPKIVEGLGEPRWVLAPNLLHHLYVGSWIDAGLEGWAAPGLATKRDDVNFAGEVAAGTSPFGEDVAVLPLSCFPFTNEVVVLHRPSRTLVVTDFVFNFPKTAPLHTRVAMRCMCAYPGCKTSLIERFRMKRPQLREDLTALREWDFDRVIMAHGDVIETGGREAVFQAFHWAGMQRALPA